MNSDRSDLTRRMRALYELAARKQDETSPADTILGLVVDALELGHAPIVDRLKARIDRLLMELSPDTSGEVYRFIEAAARMLDEHEEPAPKGMPRLETIRETAHLRHPFRWNDLRNEEGRLVYEAMEARGKAIGVWLRAQGYSELAGAIDAASGRKP